MTTVAQLLAVARTHVGVREGTSAHKAIIDTYNATKPLPVGYAVKYTDDWCDAFVTFVAIKSGAVDIIGRECGVDRHIAIFKKLGIWDENGSKTPASGDVICYNWNDNTQSNDGFADHIGIVESVKNGVITTIEGNYSNAVTRRAIRVGHGNIRGFARPKYAAASNPAPSGSSSYTVKSGDTLWDIAKAHNTSVATIKSLNGLKSDLIHKGDVLKVSGTSNRVHTVKSGESLSTIGNKYGVKWATIASKNGIKSPYIIKAGQQLKY